MSSREASPARLGTGPGRGWLGASLALAVVGAAGFLTALAGPDAHRAWQAYLANFLFWTGLSFGSVMFSATLTMTKARWGRPLKRLAEAPSAFLPVAFVLFLALYPGRAEILPWVLHPIPERAQWLNTPALFLRNALALLVLAGLGLAIVRCSVRRDAAGAALPGDRASRGRGEAVLSPLYGMAYAVVLSLLAFDLVMSLDPHWFSTNLGAYYFVGSFYSGLAALLAVAAVAARSETLGPYIGGKELRDLATLLFAFAVLTAYMFYVQLLTIWYGNVPHETEFLLRRLRAVPWRDVSWTVLALAFGFPFLVLLNRPLKSRSLPMLVVAVVVLAGMWLERFLLVAPSLWTGKTAPLGWLEVLVTLGFLGLVGCCVTVFLRTFPLVPLSDPLLRELLESRREEG
ncbi:MAG: polysulfide reductase NrfD [Deltaproteobacteria bacterium]|nr:polysulfide reductase NrfD [Deltaproteobacteria bacterium]